MMVGNNAKDRVYGIQTHLSEVRDVRYTKNNMIMMAAKREVYPEAVEDKFSKTQTLCFLTDKKYFKSRGLYLGSNKEKQYYCEELPIANKLPNFAHKEHLDGGFVIPELGIGITDDSFSTSRASFCNCDNIANKNLKVKKIHYVSMYLFFVELTDGSWLRFSSKSSVPMVIEFEAAFVDKNEVSKHKIKKELEFSPLETGSYLVVRLGNFQYRTFHTAKENFYGDGVKVKHIIFAKTFEGEHKEKGLPILYALYPFSIVFDIVTFPIQAGIFMYRSAQANKSRKK